MSTAERSIPHAGTHAEALVPPHLPQQPSERRAWLVAGMLAAVGVTVLVAVLSGVVGRNPVRAPPAVPVRVGAPQPGPAASASALVPLSAAARAPGGQAIIGDPSGAQQGLEQRRPAGAPIVHIARRWMEGFYPIYATAQSTFGVNWLLVASIHMQESAFSTAPGTYHGLNFAHCCGGPMQFNVTNGGGRGSPSTWELVSGSYVYGRRPRVYDHMTASHPSIYDDFDSIMAAAHLLSADGAGYALDGSAWAAAYDYYGHDQTGVQYADRVLARAIGWSQKGFCINCGVSGRLIAAVQGAYGAPVAASLQAEAEAAAPRSGKRSRHVSRRGPA